MDAKYSLDFMQAFTVSVNTDTMATDGNESDLLQLRTAHSYYVDGNLRNQIFGNGQSLDRSSRDEIVPGSDEDKETQRSAVSYSTPDSGRERRIGIECYLS